MRYEQRNVFVIFCQGRWKRERHREWNRVIGNTWCRPCVLTVDLSSGDFNTGSQQENKWACSILKCAAQLSSLTWLHLKFLLFFFSFFSFSERLWWMVNNPELFWGAYEVMLVRQENGLCQEVSHQHFRLSMTTEKERKILLLRWIKHYTKLN